MKLKHFPQRVWGFSAMYIKWQHKRYFAEIKMNTQRGTATEILPLNDLQ